MIIAKNEHFLTVNAQGETAIVYAMEYRGLSTDTKPTDCVVGSIFIECDTAKFYIFDGTDWNEM